MGGEDVEAQAGLGEEVAAAGGGGGEDEASLRLREAVAWGEFCCEAKMWASMVWCSPVARVMALVATLAVSMQTMASQPSGAHVGEVGGEVGPGIPDDGGVGVGFVDGDAAIEDGVVDVHGGGGVEIGAVGFAGEFEERVGLALLLEVVGLVEVLGVGEADDGDLLGVADGEVGVEGFFEVEGLAALVGDGELDAGARRRG